MKPLFATLAAAFLGLSAIASAQQPSDIDYREFKGANGKVIPAVLIGIATGKPLVGLIPQEVFVWILFVLSGVGALWLLVG